jgi:hypothetical protein
MSEPAAGLPATGATSLFVRFEVQLNRYGFTARHPPPARTTADGDPGILTEAHLPPGPLAISACMSASTASPGRFFSLAAFT